MKVREPDKNRASAWKPSESTAVRRSCKRCGHFKVCYIFRGDEGLSVFIDKLVNTLMPKTVLSRDEVESILKDAVFTILAAKCKHFEEADA